MTRAATTIIAAWLSVGLPEACWPAEHADVRELLPDRWTWPADTQGPTCGIYAVTRALQLLGTRVEPDALWNTKYVGRQDGSTPDELVSAVEVHGCKATVVPAMSIAEIDVLGCPVIANVRKYPGKEVFDHWVCVQRSERGVIVYDGPSPGREIGIPEFLALWSGIGIVVSVDEAPARIAQGVRLGGMGFLVLLGHLLLASRGGTAAPSYAILRIGVATALVALAGNALYGVGGGHQNAVAIASGPYSSSPVRNGSLDDVLRASRDGRRLLIDARAVDSYSFGTIERAVNVPVSAGYHDVKSFVRRLPRDVPVAVFCQSVTCNYDDQVAEKLAQLGFTDVIVSDAGYHEYMTGFAQGRRADRR